MPDPTLRQRLRAANKRLHTMKDYPIYTPEMMEVTDELWRRFIRKVEKSRCCWIWTGAKNERGYGRMFVGGRFILAHRISWWKQKGEWPAGKMACHTCDNPSCVNPAHIYPGTAKDNAADFAARKDIPRCCARYAGAGRRDERMRPLRIDLADRRM